MQRAALALLDWFIPANALSERSELGFARSFVVTHLLGPFLIQSIVVAIYLADPEPDGACFTMMVGVAAFWLVPFGLKLTGSLRAMAFISVELLCFTSLVGTSYYGGVNSPFLPWLLVSLMLGFFYLSDWVLGVFTLFGLNIAGLVVAHLLHSFPHHLDARQLVGISWFSVGAATAYMSFMAIYYANIVAMRSELERETERHRSMAQQLRMAKQRADEASHGKSVFLSKMIRQFQISLNRIDSASEALLARLSREPELAGWRPEVERINAAGRVVLRLVNEVVDPRSAPSVDDEDEAEEAVSLAPFLDRIAATVQPLVQARGHELVVERGPDPGEAVLDAGRLRQVLDLLIKRALQRSTQRAVILSVRREHRRTGAWIELQVRTSGLRRSDPSFSPRLDDTSSSWSTERDKVEMHCAVMGGLFEERFDEKGYANLVITLPAMPLDARQPRELQGLLRAGAAG